MFPGPSERMRALPLSGSSCYLGFLTLGGGLGSVSPSGEKTENGFSGPMSVSPPTAAVGVGDRSVSGVESLGQTLASLQGDDLGMGGRV